MIIRKYNYKLETGLVGTDDDNIASVLYNINRMEMKVSFTSSDVQKLTDALDELYFMIVDSKVHLNRFLKVSGDKVNADTTCAVIRIFDDAMKIAGDALNALEDAKNVIGAVGNEHAAVLGQIDMSKIFAVFPTVYKKLLAIVPSILALDAQAVGRV